MAIEQGRVLLNAYILQAWVDVFGEGREVAENDGERLLDGCRGFILGAGHEANKDG